MSGQIDATQAIFEVGGVANYTPTPTQPGFFGGLTAQYVFTSNLLPLASAPEIDPGTASLPLLFCWVLGIACQRRVVTS